MNDVVKVVVLFWSAWAIGALAGYAVGRAYPVGNVRVLRVATDEDDDEQEAYH